MEVLNIALKGMGLPPLMGSLSTTDAMIPGVQARQFDMIAPGLTITEARCKLVVYSSPVWVQQDALYVAPGNPRKGIGYAFFAQHPEFKLAVLTGSSQEAFALKQGIEADQLVRVADIQAGVATVTSGRANARTLSLSASSPFQAQPKRAWSSCWTGSRRSTPSAWCFARKTYASATPSIGSSMRCAPMVP